MTRRVWGTVALALLLMVTAGASQERRFVIAVARPDGHLVPFAAYNRGRWTRAWSQARTWHVWSAAAAQPTTARVSGVDQVESHCSVVRALATDLPTHATPPHTYPLTLAIAIEASADLPAGSLHTISTMPRADPGWKAAERIVRLPITALYRDTSDARSPMYVVAERRRGNHVTILTGWLIPDAAGTLKLRARAVFEGNSEVKEARTAVPLAALHLSGQLFWILQELGYENENYVIANIRAATVRPVLAVDGGGC